MTFSVIARAYPNFGA